MLDALKYALDQTGLPFAHFGWIQGSAQAQDDHGVYAEDSERTLFADNGHAEKVIQGTVDYFTRDDSGAPKAAVEAALEAAGVAWYLNTIQLESDTGFIHYEWIFEAHE